MKPSRPRHRWPQRLNVIVLCAFAALFHAGVACAGSDRDFRKLSNEFIDHWLTQRPHLATGLGLHQWNRRLEPVTESSLERETEWMRAFQAQLEQVSRTELSFDRALEYDVMKARLERELLDLEVLHTFDNDPNAYLSLVAASIHSLLQRDFASPCGRLQMATRRLRQVPEILRAARVNLRTPPRIYTEIAIEQFRGVLRLYREDVPAAAVECKHSIVQGDLAEADSTAAWAVQAFVAYLEEDLLPRSTGHFALGQETFARKLLAEELESAPLDSILVRGWKELDATRTRMETIAEAILPGRDVRAALQAMREARPEAGGLVAAAGARLDGIRAFLAENDIVSLPGRDEVIVRETPPFRRSLSFASMDAPGVWERRASEAYYNLTPADPAWSEHRTRDYLSFFNRFSLDLISVHQVLPGHYYQALAAKKLGSRLRQLFPARSTSEGWAHYCEQMMIEAGFGDGDPRYELAQLDLALQRLGRLIVGISMHTQGMSYDDAVRLFERRCFMETVNAEREARRGMADPTYLVSTLGKWRILDLRAEVKARLGDRFRLRDFHDAFLRQGVSPLPVVRAGVLRELGLTENGPRDGKI